MTRKLEPLNYEEHVAIGAELKATREQLTALIVRLGHGYGTSSKATRYANQSFARLNLLRCELDNLLCTELPLTDDRWRGVYYGK